MFGCLITEPLLPLPLAVSATRAETGVKIRHQYYNYSECRQKILLRCRHLGVGLKDVPVVVVVVCSPRKNEIMKWHFPRSAEASFFYLLPQGKWEIVGLMRWVLGLGIFFLMFFVGSLLFIFMDLFNGIPKEN